MGDFNFIETILFTLFYFLPCLIILFLFSNDVYYFMKKITKKTPLAHS
jgi:hypothetical protein